jgi:hypothetical protein
VDRERGTDAEQLRGLGRSVGRQGQVRADEPERQLDGAGEQDRHIDIADPLGDRAYDIE